MRTNGLLVLGLASVTAVGDVASGQTTITVTSFADSGPGTLRDALAVGSVDTVSTTIDFALGGGTIYLARPLPMITGEPACAVPPCSLSIIAANRDVVIDGSGITLEPENAWGLRIAAENVSVQGLVLQGFDQGGILVDGGGNFSQITDCIIGTNAAGDAVTSSTIVRDHGILVRNGAQGVVIHENVISGYARGVESLAAGIRLLGAHNTHISGNVLGLAAGGLAPVTGAGAQLDVGVHIGPDNDAVMLQPSGVANVIARQGVAGVLVEGPNVSNVQIMGNHIGTDLSGSVAHANGFDAEGEGGGIVVRGQVMGVAIGMPGQRNVVAGNVGCQLRFDGAHGGAMVMGNLLGGAPTDPVTALTDPGGSAPVANQNGVCLENGTMAVTLGQLDPPSANQIVFHRGSGGACPPDCGAAVLVHGANTQHNNVLRNLIGFASRPEQPPSGAAGNDWGLLLMNGTFRNALGNTQGSWIGNSRRAAIAVVGAGTRQNPFMGNLTFGNGMDAVPDVEICLARALNDCRVHGDVADANRGNDGVAPPVFGSSAFFITPGGAGLQPAELSGDAAGEGRVDLFRTPAVVSNSGRGGTAEWLGSTQVESTGQTFVATVTLDSGSPACVTALYTDLMGNSSELASNVRVVFGLADGLGAGSCGPRTDTTVPPTAGYSPPCARGFERDGGTCTRELGCASAGGWGGAITGLLYAIGASVRKRQRRRPR